MEDVWEEAVGEHGIGESKFRYDGRAKEARCDAYLWNTMNVKRNKKNELVVTLPANVDPVEVQRMLDYLHYLALTAGSKATPATARELAAEASAGIRKARRKQMAS
jgi:hypothetical protein